MFPQLGAPVGFFFSGITFLALSQSLSNEQFLDWGWRIPFVASALLVAVGLYVRLAITETPVFAKAAERRERVPMFTVVRHHSRALGVGILLGLSTMVLFYVMTVFTLSWGTSEMGFTRNRFLVFQLIGAFAFAVGVPVAAVLAERGRRRVGLQVNMAIIVFGLLFAPLFQAGAAGAIALTIAGMALIGLVYGPLGTQLSETFPTTVRYSGTSIAYNLSAILGASLAPYAATWLAHNHGLQYVGYYVAASGALSALGLVLVGETRDAEL
jgi:MFS family permease